MSSNIVLALVMIFEDTFKKLVSYYSCLTLLIIVQLYVPPNCMVNKDFLREIFAEEKMLLKLSEVKWIKVPRYSELSVLNLYPKFK